MRILASTLLSSFLQQLALAGSANKGEFCNQADSRLQAGTYQFWSNCNSQTYCATNNTCLPRGCRRDDFPFGYIVGSDHTPEKCPHGQFCPDEMDVCQPQLPVGSPCQMNRDGEYKHALLK